MITVRGNFFPPDEHYGRQEHAIFKQIRDQVEELWPNDNNIIINLTWFGPQFPDFPAYREIEELIAQGHEYDRLIWTGILDPVTILPQEFERIERALAPKEIYRVGVAFAGRQSFNTHAIVCTEEFPEYQDQDVELREIRHLYLNYNRKPKPHRIQFVEQLHANHLQDLGVISLGRPVEHYDVTQGLSTDLYYRLDDSSDATLNGRFSDRTHVMFGGVPPDFCSLGDLDIWQHHFLNIVSETEFLPWDTMFLTEKTLKPIIGLRPFLINGHVRIYQWLRDRGFRTFNHYWSHIDIENRPEYEVHSSIIEVVKFLAGLPRSDLQAMYQDMLPDLQHNRRQFSAFAQEQYNRVANIFSCNNTIY